MATQPRRRRNLRPFRWTSAWLGRLPDDGNRYEALDGTLLVTPQASAWHQELAARLLVQLRSWCSTHGIGTALAPGAVLWAANELQPDLLVVPGALAPGLGWSALPCPILVVEIVSPGSDRHDRYRKREAYLALGIPDYWIVDGDARTVTVCRPREPAFIATHTVSWQPRAEVPALTIDLTRLLGAVELHPRSVE